MNQETELLEILRSIAEKSLDLLMKFKFQPEHILKPLNKWCDLSDDLLALNTILISNPQLIESSISAYLKDLNMLIEQQCQHFLSGNTLSISDKKFNTKEWVDNPFFNALSQHYLLLSKHINILLEQIMYEDEHLLKKVRFFMQQFLNALSPANYLSTNPQLIAETLNSKGKNLLLGLHNFLTDIESGSSRLVVSLTDKNAFQVGENIAVTPGYVIYRNELIELIQFSPKTPKVKSIPLLIIPPWINKYYILDLSPNNSFVRWIVEQEITVFIISWINPDSQHATKGIAEYLEEGPIAAINIIKSQLNVERVNTLGFCIGGTLLSMLLAYNKARLDNSINSATFLASLIDFSNPGDISVFIDENQISKIENRMTKKGYLDGYMMASAFNSLRASELLWTFFVRNYLQGKTPAPFDLLFWNTDTTNMPAKMHSEYLRWMYLKNDLIKPNKICINNIPLNMHTIDTPTFFFSTIKDHIAPWQATYAGFKLMQGEKRFLLGGSGHVAGIIIPPGSDKYGYYVNNRAAKNPDEWFNKTQYHNGSWWPLWMSWLSKKSGRLKNAPSFNNLPIQPILKAPGSYVLKKSRALKE